MTRESNSIFTARALPKSTFERPTRAASERKVTEFQAFSLRTDARGQEKCRNLSESVEREKVLTQTVNQLNVTMSQMLSS